MKCWILFSQKSKKNIISLSSAEFANVMVNVKMKAGWLKLLVTGNC